MTIEEIQNEIVGEFELLGNDRESKLYYLMELGQQLPALPEASHIDDNLIKGCQSKVWLVSGYDGKKVSYLADSNTDITRGLIAMLIRVFDKQPADKIYQTELDFIDKIGLSSFISSQRSNGFSKMIKQMKLNALVYQQTGVATPLPQ